MSIKYTMALDPLSNEVKTICFHGCLEDEGHTAKFTYKWVPEVQDRRVQDWTEAQIREEHKKCDKTVGFRSLLNKRMTRKKERGLKMATIISKGEIE